MLPRQGSQGPGTESPGSLNCALGNLTKHVVPQMSFKKYLNVIKDWSMHSVEGAQPCIIHGGRWRPGDPGQAWNARNSMARNLFGKKLVCLCCKYKTQWQRKPKASVGRTILVALPWEEEDTTWPWPLHHGMRKLGTRNTIPRRSNKKCPFVWLCTDCTATSS